MMPVWLIVVVGVIAFFVLIVLLLVGGNWLLSLFRKPKPTSDESVRRYRERLLNPRWEEVEEKIALAVPSRVKQLYVQPELICQSKSCFSPKEGKTYYVAQFLPADAQSLSETWAAVRESKGFPFAVDYFGDTYYVPLVGKAGETCSVMCYHHDGNDFELVSSSLEEFLGWHQKSG